LSPAGPHPPDLLAGAHFVIDAPAALRTGADVIDPGGAPLEEVRAAAGELAHRYIDAVVEGFVLALARAVRGVPGAGARSARMVRGFADRFVTPGVRSARREQIDNFVGFLRHHVIERDGRTVVAFMVDEDFAQALAPALAAAAVGDPGDREALHGALHAMVDECMHHFLDAPLAMLHLGLLARAAIAVGRSGVTTRAHGLIDGVLRGPDEAAVVRLAEFLGRSVLPDE
jgi:hypothetical protein